jgi:hypothetical protein
MAGYFTSELRASTYDLHHAYSLKGLELFRSEVNKIEGDSSFRIGFNQLDEDLKCSVVTEPRTRSNSVYALRASSVLLLTKNQCPRRRSCGKQSHRLVLSWALRKDANFELHKVPTGVSR